MSVAPEAKTELQGASDKANIVLTFDNNTLASALYGQFDENLARIEQTSVPGETSSRSTVNHPRPNKRAVLSNISMACFRKAMTCRHPRLMAHCASRPHLTIN